ncbi:piggyBac transposable element-derived protein 3-like [Spodoptera litura]|uniref:PiggyBac transposable element-derived protein 3-like n=1 Tax=Spodoptera litura TaxID=69820 RepID=A0A9J7IKI9_SPOLT|nr:piggyBac transposable element-derived protein 3-like [Spodoptera litura]XP_022820385.1 piggyBac transposable element-derived protein 3-like [Spodoptera litura]XP_022831969.1 piggyBac transposable element-derived protein 3-like [Spodoptera litura]
MSARKILTVHEIISCLEEDSRTISADIYITPPENDDLSDEDSGSEETADISNLARRQLLAEAEVRRTVPSSEGILENVDGFDQEEEEEPPTTSQAIERPAKKVKTMVTRKWRYTDISVKPEKETVIPDFVLDKDNPLQFFEMFFDNEVFELLRSSTENNAIAKGHVNFRLTIEEVKNFIGILLLSGYNNVSRYRLYWDQSIDTHHPGVASCMTRNRFDELLRFFHACDNSSLPPDDKFGKVRPLWDMMNERWLKFFPGDKHLSIDESMVPYFGKHGTKQHIHGKPIRFGYKIWSLCTRLGYLIYGEPYQGAKTGNTNPNLGVGGSVVTNLISKLPATDHYSFYTDNFFTSLRLLDEVGQMGHDITGTLRANRTEGAPLKDIKEMKKTARGSFHQITDVLSNSTLVRYNDNNIVTIASTESGVQPIGKVKRWTNNKRIDVDQPHCYQLYNKYMGGVDRLDQNVGKYRIGIRLKRWYWQMMMFPINVCVNNAYQLYRLSPAGQAKDSHDFLSFTRYIVQTYLILGKASSSLPKRIGNKTAMPKKKNLPDSIRLDGKDHYIIRNETQVRCRECHKNTKFRCSKCGVGLHQHCSKSFHTEK